MLRFQTILWDMDGTLLDTLEDLQDSVNQALIHLGLPPRSLDEVRRFVGNGAGQLIDRAGPAGTPQGIRDQVFVGFRQAYQANCCRKTQPYPGILDLLTQLAAAGARMGVVSNKLDQAVKDMARRYFGPLLPVAIGDRPGLEKKPAPHSLWEAMGLLKAQPGTTLYIGDSEVDIATARNAGVDCLSVAWGFRDAPFLLEQGAAAIAYTPAEAGAYLGLTAGQPRQATSPQGEAGILS